jgi:LacI family transcriptional regulator
VARDGWFGIDDRRAIAEAAAHLIGLGHRRIGFVGGHVGLSTGRARLAGFRDAHADAGLPPPDALLRLGPPDAGFARTAVADLIDAPERPTAILAAGAGLTAGMIEAAGARGLAVPAQMSLVGFGDAPWFRWWGPGLTTMALPAYELAFACGGALMRMIGARDGGEGGGAPAPAPVRALHAPTLTVRGSTAHV